MYNFYMQYVKSEKYGVFCVLWHWKILYQAIE
jgi:hypothetical protein